MADALSTPPQIRRLAVAAKRARDQIDCRDLVRAAMVIDGWWMDGATL